jgi:5-methylcytosine-specific restriction endonuclease McrA
MAKDDHDEILKLFNYRCALNPAHSNPVIHHIIPRGVGGTDDLENLIPLCYRCHGKIHIEGTRKWRERLFKVKNDQICR